MTMMTLPSGVGRARDPAHPDGSEIDTESLARQVQHYVRTGATGLTVGWRWGRAARGVMIISRARPVFRPSTPPNAATSVASR
jgi:hypothetical protein